jgi:hypothetical protein
MEPDFGLTGRQLCHLTWIVIMDTSTVVDLGRQALWITVLISAPLLGIALLVGLIIGVRGDGFIGCGRWFSLLWVY